MPSATLVSMPLWSNQARISGNSVSIVWTCAHLMHANDRLHARAHTHMSVVLQYVPVWSYNMGVPAFACLRKNN
jgi:hypothetical protein